MIDFQAIHEKQLQVYNRFAARKHQSLQPLQHTNRLISKLNRINNQYGELVREKTYLIPKEYKGRKVDLWVYNLPPPENKFFL